MLGRFFITLVISLPLVIGQGENGEDEAWIYFRWDRTEFDGSYLENREAISALKLILDQAGSDRIESVTVTAYASPEGVREHNLKLSRKRTKTLLQLVDEYLPGYAQHIIVRDGGEAWEPLRKRIAEDPRLSDAARRKILNILDDGSVGHDTKKWRLQNRLGSDPVLGDLYDYILKNHFCYLRCLHIKIRYTDSDERKSGTPEIIPQEAAGPPPAEAQPQEQEELHPDHPVQQEESELPHQPEADDNHILPEVGEALFDALTELIKPLRPVFAVSTNLLYDGTYVPNYGFTSIPSFSVEYYPSKYGRVSFGADVEWPMWQHPDEHRYLQIQNITLNGRWYFAKTYLSNYRGPYVLANVNFARYGIGWEEHGWEGEGFGASVGIGYKHSLFGSKRLFWDTGIALGGFYTKYDPYVWGNDATGWYYYDYVGDPAKFSERSKGMAWFGPTRVYFSIGIDLFNRKK